MFPLMNFRLSLLAAVLSVSAPAATAGPPGRPNFVFVLVDDLRWDELGCAGHPYLRTPHLDRVAREGVFFRNAFATTPLCSPSRASLLTGQYAHRHGIVDNTDRSADSHRLDTFPRRLQAAGYETAFLGKWHMGNDPTPRPGFDVWTCLKGQGSTNDPELYENGVAAKVPGYVTDILTDRAVAFLRRERAKPFLLYLAHKALHPETAQNADGSLTDPGASRFIPAERHRTLYAGAPVPRRPNALAPPEGKPALLRRIGDLPPLGPVTGTSDETVRDRQRMLSAVDEGLGAVFRALEETGRLDDTVVVVTSDHGYFYGEHGLSVERRLAYEEAVRIPLLVRYPVRKARGTIDATALTIDLAPTLLDLAGVPVPETMQGRSLAPLLDGAAMNSRSSFLIEYFTDTVFPRVHKMGYRAVRTGRWKYIHYTELEGMDELYDLEADPYEMKNRIGDPAARSDLDTLKGELDRILAETR